MDLKKVGIFLFEINIKCDNSVCMQCKRDQVKRERKRVREREKKRSRAHQAQPLYLTNFYLIWFYYSLTSRYYAYTLHTNERDHSLDHHHIWSLAHHRLKWSRIMLTTAIQQHTQYLSWPLDFVFSEKKKRKLSIKVIYTYFENQHFLNGW